MTFAVLTAIRFVHPNEIGHLIDTGIIVFTWYWLLLGRLGVQHLLMTFRRPTLKHYLIFILVSVTDNCPY